MFSAGVYCNFYFFDKREIEFERSMIQKRKMSFGVK